MLKPRYIKGIFALLWISFLLGIPFFLSMFQIITWDRYGTLILPSFFVLSALITLYFGLSEQVKINEFIKKRALISWKYSSEEWAYIMKKQKKEQKGDWRFILIFFVAISFAVSVLMGFSTENLMLSFYIFAAGAVFGLGLSLINHFCDISEYNSKINRPGETALGEGEFFYNDIYFRHNEKSSILRRELKDAKLAVIEDKRYLMLTTMERMFRRYSGLTETHHTFQILVPEKKYDQLHKILDRLKTKE